MRDCARATACASLSARPPTLVDAAGAAAAAGLLPESGANFCCRSCSVKGSTPRGVSENKLKKLHRNPPAAHSVIHYPSASTRISRREHTLRMASMLLGAGSSSAAAGAGTARGRAPPPAAAARLAAGCGCRARFSPASCSDCSSVSLPSRRLRCVASDTERPGPCTHRAAQHGNHLSRRQAAIKS